MQPEQRIFQWCFDSSLSTGICDSINFSYCTSIAHMHVVVMTRSLMLTFICDCNFYSNLKVFF